MPKGEKVAHKTQSSQKRRVSNGKTKATVSRRSPRKKRTREMPRWFFTLLVVFVIAVAVFLFYFFVIRPYSYRWRPCYGLEEYGVCIPSGYTVHGIDVSRHQGVIEWDSLKAKMSSKAPISFVFIKATEGCDYTDPMYEQYFEHSRSRGFLRGVYHFFNFNTSGVTQAEFFINTVHLDDGDLPPVVDVEVKPKSKQVLQKELKAWLETVERHYGVKPIIYSSNKYRKRYLDDSFFDQYPFWIAHYYVEDVDENMEWAFWQHTDVGTLPGIEESVDLNIFNGTDEQLLQLTIGSQKK